MPSMYRNLASWLAARLRNDNVATEAVFRPPSEQNTPDLIVELGLTSSGKPMRDHPNWRIPSRVLVNGASAALLQWLQPAAPRITLTAIHGVDDGLANVSDADAIIGWFTPAMLAAGSRLTWLQIHTAGVENAIRAEDIRGRSIVVTNLKRTAGPTIAEHTFAMLLSLTRKLRFLDERQRQRRWAQYELAADRYDTLRGKTMVIVGIGGIGSEIAKLAHAFGMRVIGVRTAAHSDALFVARVGTLDDLPELVGEAHIVVNALPLTTTTRGVFDHRLFGKMRGAVFVNVARGASTVTKDLAAALQRGTISAAALDVTDPEPLPANHALWRMPNVIITHHVAALSRAAIDNGWFVVRENLRRFANGEALLNVVDVERGY